MPQEEPTCECPSHQMTLQEFVCEILSLERSFSWPETTGSPIYPAHKQVSTCRHTCWELVWGMHLQTELLC